MATEQKLGISDRFREFWQLHWKCVMVGLAFIIVVIITGWVADRVTDSSRYLSTASIVLSIALSLVVIGYTVFQNVIAAINADRMERLVERVEGKIEHVGENVNTLIGTQENLQVSTQRDEDTTSQSATEVGKGEVYFSLFSTSPLSILFAYFLLRSHELGKPLSIEFLKPILTPLVKMSNDQLHSYIYGVLHGMICCLKDFVLLPDQSHVQLVKLPTNFREHLEVVKKGTIDMSPELAAYFKQIDHIYI